jgi:hypothetical protein
MLKATSSIVNVSQITGVLPVVNGGTGVTTSTGTGSTVLSAAPTLSGNVTLSTGNLVVADTKGIDFSATPGTGTSELFDDYEEGTWTPTDTSGAGLTLTVNNANYTKIGRLVYFALDISYPITVNPNAMQIGNFPFAITQDAGASIGYTTFSPGTQTFAQISSSINAVRLQTSGGTTYANSTMSNLRFQISGSYTA